MRNQKTYFLDLQTLLTYLDGQSCELTTELKVSGKIARGSIILKDGRIARCLVSLPGGFQTTGEQAYKQLEGCTEWRVELIQPEEKKKMPPMVQFSPQITSPFPQLSAPANNAWNPFPLRQKRPLDPLYLQSLPMKERFIVLSVFAMIDGTRSSEEIKAQLHLSPWDVDDALARLRALDLIE